MILPFFGFEKNYKVQCQVQGLLVCSLQGRFDTVMIFLNYFGMKFLL